MLNSGESNLGVVIAHGKTADVWFCGPDDVLSVPTVSISFPDGNGVMVRPEYELGCRGRTELHHLQFAEQFAAAAFQYLAEM